MSPFDKKYEYSPIFIFNNENYENYEIFIKSRPNILRYKLNITYLEVIFMTDFLC